MSSRNFFFKFQRVVYNSIFPFKQKYTLKCFKCVQINPFNVGLNFSQKTHLVTFRTYCKVGENIRPIIPINEELLHVFTSYGFSENNVEDICKACPEVLHLPPEKLEEILSCWTQCHFGSERTVALILKNPNLVFVSAKRLDNLYSYLYSVFMTKDLYNMFFNCPRMILENIDMLEEKMDYLENVMNLSRGQIVNSTCLEYPLHHIKERHEFLKRVGMYKTPDKKNPEYFKSNPKLDKIVATSDKYFSTKVAGVSSFEYEVFQQSFSVDEDD